MAEYTKKKDRINMHKLTVLNHLIMETLDDLQVNNEFREEHKKAFTPAMNYIETFFDGTMIDNDNPVKAVMYISELSEKIDTVMRKNYTPC